MNSKIKSTYILLLSAVLLSACSQENEVIPVVEGHGKPVIFTTSLPGISSRAVIRTEDNIPSFQVTAFNPADDRLHSGTALKEHFSNQRVEVEKGQLQHSSDSCVWPRPGLEGDVVHFFAFHPALHDGATLENNSTVSGATHNFDYKLKDFSVKPDIADQVDFVTAYTNGTMFDNLFSGVKLPFVHQLSRVEVRAWSANKSCDIEIAGVRLGGVGVKGTFAFKADDNAGEWEAATIERGIVEYIFREGDVVVALNKGADATSTSAGAVSIMGNSQPDGNNAMVIPTTDTNGWDWSKDKNNANKQMYISVLLRVIDHTPITETSPENPQRYPYHDLSQGDNALNPQRPVVYLVVDKTTGTVSTRVYKEAGPGDYTDADGKTYNLKTADGQIYTLKPNEEVREFGWAALPVTAAWAPGNIYIYTLDYTSGVGLHDPEVTVTNPGAGDPIITDKVGVSYKVEEWKDGGGSEFIVPGS